MMQNHEGEKRTNPNRKIPFFAEKTTKNNPSGRAITPKQRLPRQNPTRNYPLERNKVMFKGNHKVTPGTWP
jgi:hypothetical protein